MEDNGDYAIREVKNYKDADQLIANIRKQTERRQNCFGERLQEITFVISPKFSIEDADRIEEECRRLGVSIEFVYK